MHLNRLYPRTHMAHTTLEKYKTVLEKVSETIATGEVLQVRGTVIVSSGPPNSKIGDIVKIELKKRKKIKFILCEVLGFEKNQLILIPMGSTDGIYAHARVIASTQVMSLPVSYSLLGRILNGLGEAIDEKGPTYNPDDPDLEYRNIIAEKFSPIKRKPIRQILQTGVRSIDGLISVGCGQRLGIFAGTGVGKSTLLGMIARYTQADINIICLVGERGREVKEFIENDLGEEGLKKSIVFVATIDSSMMEQVYCVNLAATAAEYFRDRGHNVNFYMDSLTRYVRAMRDIGLHSGESIGPGGFPSGVWHRMNGLLERAGNNNKGSITGFYTILIEADDIKDPIADHARSVLDGHIILSRQLAEKSHYPAIEVTESFSRVMDKVINAEHYRLSRKMRQLLAHYKQNEDIIQLQAYPMGSDPLIDEAIHKRAQILEFLQQEIENCVSLDVLIAEMKQIVDTKMPS